MSCRAASERIPSCRQVATTTRQKINTTSGIKGTLSELELYSIRLRLQGGRDNKAQRRELRTQLPTGLEHDESGAAVRESNAAV